MSIDTMLHGHELFRNLGVEDVDAISQLSGVKELGKGDVLFNYRAPATHLFLLLEGTMQLELPGEHGHSVNVCKVHKGEIFGLSSLLSNERYTTLGRATQPATVLTIEAEPFVKILQDNPVLGLGVMGRVAHVYFTRYIGVMERLQGALDQLL